MHKHTFVNRVIQLLLIFLFMVNVGEGFAAPVYAVFVKETIAGASLKTVGFSFAILAIVKSLLQVPLARRIDKKKGERDDFFVMLAGSLLGMFAAVSLAFVRTIPELYGAAAVSGVASACLMAAYYALFARHADKDSQGFEWSLFSVWGLTISAAIGGALGGIIGDALGFQSTFLLTAAFYLLATLLLIVLYPFLDREEHQ